MADQWPTIMVTDIEPQLFADECPAMEWFGNRLEAKVVIEDRRQHCKTVWSHSSLNQETPEAFTGNQAKTLLTGAIPA